MLQITAELIDRQLQGPGQELRLRAPELAQQLSPGQAVLLRGGWGPEPHLRRTFHPVAIDGESWTIRVPPSGDRAHAWLRTAPLGAEIDCLGPVGRGFSLPSGPRNLLCIGQGEPAWALLPLILLADTRRAAVTFAMQSHSYRDLIPPHRLPATVEYRVATLDGGRGDLGRLLPGLAEAMRWADAVAAAGSAAFYEELARAIEDARYALGRGFAQALHPTTFLCGVGACQACVADVAGGRRRVCLRGPVFDLVDLVAGR